MLLLALLACRPTKDLTDSAVDTGTRVDADGDGAWANEDCDDQNNAVYPDNVETPYNGVDDDCDETTLDDDLDGDGVLNEFDCDDDNPDINPTAVEVCNGEDDDCNGEVDDAVGDLWYEDDDGDGFGDPAESSQDCTGDEGTVAQADDCDDQDAAVHPDAEETCNETDDDCDDSIDEDVESTFHADADNDGAGDPATSEQGCEPSPGYVENEDDCDDTDGAVNPNATEVCNGVDDDCDTETDEDDAADALTWYLDDDEDTYGDPDETTASCEQPTDYVDNDEDCDDSDPDLNPDTLWYVDYDSDGYGSDTLTLASCEQPSGFVDDDTDCDDTDADAWPGNTETWYDGVDGDCGGDDDYDADGDGEQAYDYGGTDCDDTDASTNEAAGNCRATCTPPSTTTLAANDPSGVTDLQFDEDCLAYVTTVISGTDYVYTIDSNGSATVYSGASNHDIGSVAVDPSGSGDFAISYNNVGYFGFVSGSSIPVAATGGYRKGTNWSNQYLNNNASSMAWDANGCIWVPNFNASGSVDCFASSGSYTTLATLSGYVESVALDDADTLFVSVDEEVYELDSSGTATLYYDVGDIVLDMVFDITGELYILTDAGDIVLVDNSASSHSTYTTVSGEGKLAISPDGTLYYMKSNPVSAASYTSWSL